MDSPIFNLFEEDPQSRFLNLFNRFSEQSPQIGEYLDPNDPDLLKYQELASSPTGSENLISEYIGARPTREQYSPSIGRRMAAFLIGTLSGTGARGAQGFVDQPYNYAEEEWTNEGRNIASRARLIDAERNRELQALKFTLGTKERGLRAKSVDEFKREQEARRLADNVAREEERARQAEALAESRKFNQNMSKLIFNQRKEMDEIRKQNILDDNARANAANKRAAEEAAYRANDLERINKDLAAHASQAGIDTSEMNALEIATELAHKRTKAHPAFGDLLEETDNGWKIISSVERGGEPRIRIMKNYMNSLIQKYLRGEFK